MRFYPSWNKLNNEQQPISTYHILITSILPTGSAYHVVLDFLQGEMERRRLASFLDVDHRR